MSCAPPGPLLYMLYGFSKTLNILRVLSVRVHTGQTGPGGRGGSSEPRHPSVLSLPFILFSLA